MTTRKLLQGTIKNVWTTYKGQQRGNILYNQYNCSGGLTVFLSKGEAIFGLPVLTHHPETNQHPSWQPPRTCSGRCEEQGRAEQDPLGLRSKRANLTSARGRVAPV